MNDFTKEELMIIHDSVGNPVLEQVTLSETYAIKRKIQSLIENYCEHDTSEEVGGSIGCHKCGEFYR